MTKEVKNSKIGRPKGSPNLRTQELFAIAERLDCNPFEILLHFAKGDYEALNLPEWNEKSTKDGAKIKEPSISPELRQKSARDACEYLFPKRKAVEHSFDGDDDPISSFIERLSGN
jgi:hypothetical protein